MKKSDIILRMPDVSKKIRWLVTNYGTHDGIYSIPNNQTINTLVNTDTCGALYMKVTLDSGNSLAFKIYLLRGKAKKREILIYSEDLYYVTYSIEDESTLSKVTDIIEKNYQMKKEEYDQLQQDDEDWMKKQIEQFKL